jgi:hypothetical protein
MFVARIMLISLAGAFVAGSLGLRGSVGRSGAS